MGRNAGWLTGAAALAKGEDCLGPDLIYLPELPFDIEAFSEKVKDLLAKKPSVVVAVSEESVSPTEDMYANSDKALILSMRSVTNSFRELRTISQAISPENSAAKPVRSN